MTPHLRGHVRAYVDRALPPPLLHLFDQHLVCCAVCRDAADRERRIVAALRADTHVPTGLRSSLLGLAAVGEPPPWGDGAPGSGRQGDGERSAWPQRRPAPAGPPVPVAPVGFRPVARAPEPVPTVHPSAPALHRSPMRAAVVASLAAGASVAAAWGLAVSPVPGGGRLPTSRVPVASFGAGSPAATPVARAVPSTSAERSSGGSGTRLAAPGFGAVTVPFWVVTTRTADRSPQAGQVRFSGSGPAQSAP